MKCCNNWGLFSLRKKLSKANMAMMYKSMCGMEELDGETFFSLIDIAKTQDHNAGT